MQLFDATDRTPERVGIVIGAVITAILYVGVIVLMVGRYCARASNPARLYRQGAICISSGFSGPRSCRCLTASIAFARVGSLPAF
jgi:hypothetical protein